MPRGGWRGGGRPTKEAAAAKEKALLETIESGKRLDPRVYLQAVLASPGSTKTEKMRACELLLRMPPEPKPAASGSSSAETVHVWALPRGAQVGADGKVLWPDGTETEPEAVTPFEGTPELPPMPKRREPKPDAELAESVLPFETAEEPPPSNVQPLRPHERGVSFGARHDPSRTPSAMNPFNYKPRGD